MERPTPLRRAVEDKLDPVLAFCQQQVDERYWYGYWYYGDFIDSMRSTWSRQQIADFKIYQLD